MGKLRKPATLEQIEAALWTTDQETFTTIASKIALIKQTRFPSVRKKIAKISAGHKARKSVDASTDQPSEL